MLEDWQARCLEHLRAFPGAELALIVHPREPLTQPSSRLTRRLLSKSKSGRRVDIASAVSGVPAILCDTVRSSEAHRRDRVAGQNGEAIRSHELAFVLDLGSGLRFDDELDVASDGIWAFDRSTADPRRRALAWFWRVYREVPVAEVTLLGLPARVLRQGFFRTDRRSFARTADVLLSECAKWPGRACLDIREGNAGSGTVAAGPLVDPDPPAPNALHLLAFLAKILWSHLLAAWARFFRHPQWNIGVVREPIHSFLVPLDPPRVEWSPFASKRGFLSDPFGAVVDGKVTVLYEYFDYRKGRGTINSIDLREWTERIDVEPVLDRGCHMSYPFVLEHEDEIYCIPETAAAREVALYRAVEFPSRWEKVSTILDGFAGVDTTVFRHGGSWWLTCTDNEDNPDTNLLVWHASRLEGPWVAHAANPVKIDVRSARPGGTPFVHRGELYRPAQDCSRAYGGRVVVNRVTRLTPQEFAEEPAATFEPSAASPFPDGRHTLSAVGDITLVDGHRFVFVAAALRHFLRIWGRNLATGLGRKLRIASSPGARTPERAESNRGRID